MPKYKAVFMLLAVMLIVTTNGALTIFSVSLQFPGTTTSLQGSVMGGTKLYISGLGFSPIMSDNTMFVGDFPCKLQDGATDTTILCTTTPTDSFKQYYSLPITVNVLGIGQATANEKFSYVNSQTPMLYNIFPSVSYGGEQTLLYLSGIHRISYLGADKDLGNVYGIYIGQSICSRFGIFQDSIDPNSNNFIQCYQPTLQQAGKYNVSEHLYPGRSASHQLSYKASLNNQMYQFVVLPLINKTTQSGSIAGQQIEIKGTGFSTNPNNISVSVDGVNCQIQSSTLTTINCKLQKLSNQQSSILQSNSESPISQYTSGSGFFYQRYDISQLSPQNIVKLKSLIDAGAIDKSTLIDSYVSGEIKTGDTFGAYYGEVWKGYFVPTQTGEYTFRGVADDTFAVYLSTQTYGSVVSLTDPLIYANSYTPTALYPNYYYNNYPNASSNPILLQKGKHYYMQVYHINYGGTGSFSLSVEVPNTDDTISRWQTYEVQSIVTSMTQDPEIIQFTSTGVTSGTINLRVYEINKATLDVLIDQNVTIQWNATASQFCNAINQFSWFYYYGTTCTLAMKDSSGSTTANSSNAVTFLWTVSIASFRTSDLQAHQFIVVYSVSGGQFSTNKIQDHSPIMSGTFTLTLNDTPIMLSNNVTDIPFNIDSGSIESALRKRVGFKYAKVERVGDPTTGCKWNIYYIGYNGNVLNIVASGAGLLGGRPGTTPTIAASTIRQYSTDLFIDPIDYRWMRTFSDQPNVMVKVNGISSACNTDCRITFLQQVPRVTNIELTGYTLSLTLVDPQSINLPLNQITVYLDNQPCTSLTGTMASFTCELPYNPSDMSPILSAGTHYPVILLGSLGYADIDDYLIPIQISLQMFSLDLTQGPANGGYKLTVNGTGFPSADNNKNDISFTLCNKQCHIDSITNNEAVITVPSCEYADFSFVQVRFNNMTDALSFKYTPFDTSVQINSISPSSWSPVRKSVMTITGQGFGNDTTFLQAYISNSSGNVYKMKILKGNDSELTVGIPGGLPGTYVVNIYKQDFGYATPVPEVANQFVYEVSVSSITPSSGSIYGGTLITISGVNFVPDSLQTMVTIGNELNQICAIETITESEIQCRTPTKNQYYDVNDTLQVIVESKLIIPTNCSSEDDCWFSYISQTESPFLESISSTAISATGSLTLTGQNFDIGSDIKVTLYNKITKNIIVLTPTSNNSTSITVTLPNLQSGFYDVRARIDPIGESNPLLLTANMDLKSPTVSQISINGGQVSIEGWGLPQSWPKDYYKKLSFTKNKLVLPLDIISLTTTKIVLRVPSGKDGQVYKFSVTSPTGISKTVQFSLSSTKTPTMDLTSTQSISPNTQILISLNRTAMTTTLPTSIQIYSISNPSYVYNVLSWINTSSVVNFNVTLNSGKYGFKIYSQVYGWYTMTQRSLLSVQKSGTYSTANTPQGVSFNGGTVTVYGNYIGEGAIITVNGLVGTVKSQTISSAEFYLPKMITPLSQSEFKLAKNSTIDLLQVATVWGDSSGWQAAFDKEPSTTYYSLNSPCSLGIDIGTNLGIQLTRIRYFPNSTWDVASSYIKDAIFEVSNDNITYTNIGTVDQNVHAGWNSIMINDQNIYRYVRFSHTDGASYCSLAEFELTGIIMSTIDITDTTSFLSDLIIDDGLNQQVLTGAIDYRKDKTSVVNSVTPNNGDVFGGYEITITGLYFAVGIPTVSIDNIQCTVIGSSDTQINCTVGQRLNLPLEVNFNVMIGSAPAIINEKFRYVMRWSDPRTWGTDLPPVENDLVYVPQGMHLLVDESTPILAGIIIENATIEFSDQVGMTVEAGFITLRGGEFIAGTQSNPYQHQLTFIMHGNYFGTQQPIFGNKGIGCLQCKFTMIGQKRTPTWTTIAATVNPGENQFTTSQDVDWKVGQVIVLASTSYDHNEAEMRTITNIEGRQITVDQNFVYQHYSDVESYGENDKLQMRAQVGLLSRNIKMMGDDQSIITDYGSHLMLAGSAENGLVGKIAYVEFTKCGQPQILGRYCHHFHMNGDVPESYSIGNSVHHSMARVLTIHGVHFLYVAWNVGYKVKGHNFFIQDGVETNNILEYNLAISSLQVNNMLQTDMSVASFWVTNPSNHLRYNHAAGSDFYGIWYQIKEHPDGPSATEDICPIGNPLGESHDNVAHSNVRFGLRIFRMYARQYPCLPIRDDTLVDPWSSNPSIQSRFYNYVLWKNGQAGLLAEQVGNMIFENFTIGESKLAGMEFYMTNFTKQRVLAKNIAIIGKSTGNPPQNDLQLGLSHGAILSRTGQMQLQDIRFYQFTEQMTVWQACSKCDNLLLYTNFGATYYTSQIQYSAINGKFLNMLGLKRQVFYDLDGTLTNGVFDTETRTSSSLAFGWPHLLQDPACLPSSSPQNWDTATACDQTVTMRQVMFTNLQKVQQFRSQSLKAHMLNSPQDITAVNQTVFTSILSLQKNMQPKKEMKFTFSLPYLTNRIYNIWWGTGINFLHMAMVSSHLFTQQDNAIIFKFNYTQNRELFEIAPLRQGGAFNYSLMKSESSQLLDMNTCGNGDYYHDNSDTQRILDLCASGKNRTLFQYTDVNAIYCRYLCPAPPGSCTKQTFLRNWSNATQWPNSSIPSAGQNVIIPCQWTIMMDMSPNKIGYFEINGDIIIPDSQDILIEAENIWIKTGSLKAGTNTTPFTHKLALQINGNFDDIGFTVSPDLTGNKMIVNTGRLQLFGSPPTTTWTRLTAFANIGDTSITVLSTTGWKIGDQIGIAPSFTGQTQFEKVTITAINGNIVTFAPALKYNHFGDTKTTISKSYGSLDTRAGIAHLTRNIQIKAGADIGWGFHLVQFGYLRTLDDNSTIIQTGNMTLIGVQFINGGQYDTERAGLQIVNVRRYTEYTLISQSSFHQCQDFCLRLDNIYDVEINNNVFFNAKKFHVRALDIFGFTFTNNLMIGVTKRPTMTMDDLIGCFASWNSVDPKTDILSITNNLCQGSQGNGFIVPHVDCQDIEIYPFAGNTAGSCDIGWIFARGTGDCLAAKGIYAYSSQIGQMHNPPDTLTTEFKNFILADNVRSMTIRIGGSSSQKTAYVNDSYITAISRPDCVKCYGDSANQCTNNQGVRMLTTGSNGEMLPDKFGHGFDVVCKQQTIDGKVFIYNTQFDSFKTEYTELPQCSNNVIFKPHTGGTDFTASHHLFNSTCTNCQLGAYAYFTPPPTSQLGWLGGCGDILCTGNNNYYIHDVDGTFLPQKGILLANNSWIGDHTSTCQQIQSLNGYYCKDQDYGVLEYESVAPDFNTRIMWPVMITPEGNAWTSVTNGWREWQWNGGQPLNKRLGRFVTVIPLHQMYNMTFTSMPPQDITFKLQKRLPVGNTSDWVIVKLMYPKPNSIRVQVNGQGIRPILLKDNETQLLDTTQCGSNKFFYKNYTIHFVVTGDPTCKVRVTLTNSIQLTTTFDMNIDDFYKNDGATKFIDRLCALLQITDTSRVKVVGVWTGSVNIVTNIEPQPTALDSSTSASASSISSALNLLNSQLQQLISNGKLQTAMSSQGFGSIISASSSVTQPTSSSSSNTDSSGTSNDTNNGGTSNNTNNNSNNNSNNTSNDSQVSSSSPNTGMIVGIVVGIVTLVCLVAVGVFCYFRRSVKIPDDKYDIDDEFENYSDTIKEDKNPSAVELQERKDLF